MLVTPDLETNPDFFFKHKDSSFIDCRQSDGTVKIFNSDTAAIELTELPFIRLRSKLLLESKDFRGLVTESQKDIDTAVIHPSLTLNLYDRTIVINNITVELTPVQTVIYMLFLRQKLGNCRERSRKYCIDCTECFRHLSEYTDLPTLRTMAEDYAATYKNQAMKKKELFQKWPEGMKVEAIRINIRKINKEIKEALTDSILQPYYIISNLKRYG